MERKINENILKLSSAGINLPQKLEQGFRYKIETDIDIYEITERDNQDGTINMIYKGRSTGEVSILNTQGKLIKAQEKKKVSQSIHGAIWYVHNFGGLTEDFNNYYERQGKKMASYMPEIIKFLDSKD